MKSLSWKAKVYILLTILMGVVLLAWHLTLLNWREPGMLIVLSGLASLTLIIKVLGTTNRTHYNVSFLIYAFTFILYGPGEAILVIVVSNLVEWAWHKYPWYIQSFNIGAYLIAIQITGLFYHWMNPAHTLLDFPGVLSGLAAVGIFTLFNHLLVGIVVWLARGENFVKSGIFDSLPLIIDFTLLSMGVSAAIAWTLSPFAILPILLPLYLIYTTLRVPALERQTELDPKTGLFNANHFAKALENELKRASRFDRPFTIVMGDLDLLRNINNTYGHLAGDQVLIGIANILKQHTREYDTVCRFGGEEFAILIPESTAEQVLPHVEAIREAISKTEFTVPTSVTSIQATMSFGIACRNIYAQTANGIIHNADIALYHAKLTGRNRTVVYTDDAYQEIVGNRGEAFLKSPSPSLSERIQANSYPHQPNPIRDASPTPPEGNQPEQAGQAPQEPEKKQPDKPEDAPQAQLKKRFEWKVGLFIAGTACLALALLFVTPQPARPLDYPGLVMFALTLILTELFSIDLYVRDTSVSTSAVPIMAGALLFGSQAAILFSLIFATVAMFKHRILLDRFIFNASNQLIGCMLIINLSLSIGVSISQLNPGLQALVCLITSVILFLSTTVLISFVIGIDMRQSPWETWKEKFSWLAPSYLAMGLIAFALVYSYHTAGVISTVITLIPLYLLRLSQFQYIERTKGLVTELREKNQTLENTAFEVISLNDGLLDTLSVVIDHRDPYVLEHSKKVAQYAVSIAEQMRMHPKQVELIRKASLMHDVGKLGIPDAILQKPEALTKDEFQIIKSHPMVGAKILETTRGMQQFIPIVRYHHERYDGKGYPDGLCGQGIPLEARIVALADAIDAMASDRPYRKALSRDHILHEIQANTGTQFDPQVVAAYLKSIQETRNEMQFPRESIHPKVEVTLERAL